MTPEELQLNDYMHALEKCCEEGKEKDLVVIELNTKGKELIPEKDPSQNLDTLLSMSMTQEQEELLRKADKTPIHTAKLSLRISNPSGPLRCVLIRLG